MRAESDYLRAGATLQIAGTATSVFGDTFAYALDRQSRSVTIAGRGRRARSADMDGCISSFTVGCSATELAFLQHAPR